MGQALTELTNEELWQLFPISLIEHQRCWSDWYREEQTALDQILPQL